MTGSANTRRSPPFLAVLPLRIADGFLSASIGPRAAGCTRHAPRFPIGIDHANASGANEAPAGVLPINGSRRTSCDTP